MDRHINGLSNTLTNALKLIPGKGIGWTCYHALCSLSVDLPRDNPILSSYATLLSNGYVCAWKKSGNLEQPGGPDLTSPITPTNQVNVLGEKMELWLFYSEHPSDIQSILSPQLKQVASGAWKEGVPPDHGICQMLFKALRNAIERSLVEKGFYPLGQWFAKPDVDSLEWSCVMCKFSLFLHAHEVICTSIDIKTLSDVTTLTSDLLSKAMVSKSGLKVLLSPSGLSATLTGHTYTMADESVREIVEEWKLFYPKMFFPEFDSDLPVAVEVVIGGVRMKYPSHGVLVMGCVEEEDLADMAKKSCHRDDTSDVLQKWSSHYQKDSNDLSKICNCKVAQKAIQQSLGKGEKVSLSDIRLNPKRQKEDETFSEKSTYDPSEQPTPAKLLKRDSMFDSSTVPVSIGPLGWSKGGMSGVPKYATPLPSPCVSLPNSPTNQQQTLPGDNSTSIAMKSPLQDSYDPKFASGKLSVDAQRWNNREQGWWTCLSLPQDTETEQNGCLEEKNTSRLPKQIEALHSVQQKPTDRVSSASDSGRKPPSILSISGLPSPIEEPICTTAAKHPVINGKPVTSQHTNESRKSYISEMPIDSKHQDYMSMDLLNVPESLDNIFDDDDADHDCQAVKMSSQNTAMEVKKSGGSKDILVDLHRMFPTPPSVEQTSCIEDCVPEEQIEPIDSISSKDSWDTPASDDEQQYIPSSFAPLPDLPNKADLSPDYYYSLSTKACSSVPGGSIEVTSPGLDRVCEVASQPDKFLFPPLPSFAINEGKNPKTKKRPEKLGLNSVSRTPLPTNPVLSTPMHSPALRTSRHNSFYHHLSSRTTTPRDSPAVVGVELMTPTPAVLNKLLPALPEAHALYFTLHLASCESVQDSLSEPYSYQPASISGEECFTFSTLGFEEDVQEFGDPSESDWIAIGRDGVTKSGFVEFSNSYPIHSLPEISPGLLKTLQNLSFQTLFEDTDVPSRIEYSMKSSKTVYSEKLFVSAICQSQFLMSQQSKSQFSPYLVKQQATIVPTTEGNTGEWLWLLHSVSNATITKHVNDIKGILDVCFFNTQSLLVKPEGPLSLRDFQQLRSSQTILGSDCAPLPVPPILVGHEQDLLSVSPLCMSVWEFMTFEPFSIKKDMVYLAIVPDQHNFVTASSSFFKEVSITYEGCSLGKHVPFSKNGIAGVIPVRSDPMSPSVSFASDVKKCIRETIVPVLKDMSSDPKTDLQNMMSSNSTSNCLATSYTLGSHQPGCPSIVLYLVIAKETDCKEFIQILDVVDKVMNDECVPYEVRKLLFIQIVNPETIEGFFEILFSGKQLKKWAFGTYSCCREYYQNPREAPSLTCFGPANDRKERIKMYPPRKHFAPLFVLAPDNSTVQTGGQPHGVTTHDEEVLFLSYCVSSDKRWLLTTSCDKHGEILNTAIIEIHPIDNKYYQVRPRFLALQKLWDYCISVISGTLLRWSVVVTRVGVPSWGELTEWHEIIQDDGLLTANKILKGQCIACQEASKYPELISVIISSMQPECTFKLLPCQDYSTSFSHAIVLPPHPLIIPHSPQEPGVEDITAFFGGGGNIPDTIDDNIFDELDDAQFWNLEEEPPAAISGEAINQPLAKGYLISPDSLGKSRLWKDSPSSGASILKTLLHWQFTEIRHKNQSTPQEKLGSLLLQFDALAWLNIESSSQLRKSCLPIHIMLLTNLSKIMDILLD